MEKIYKFNAPGKGTDEIKTAPVDALSFAIQTDEHLQDL